MFSTRVYLRRSLSPNSTTCPAEPRFCCASTRLAESASWAASCHSADGGWQAKPAKSATTIGNFILLPPPDTAGASTHSGVSGWDEERGARCARNTRVNDMRLGPWQTWRQREVNSPEFAGLADSA